MKYKLLFGFFAILVGVAIWSLKPDKAFGRAVSNSEASILRGGQCAPCLWMEKFWCDPAGGCVGAWVWKGGEEILDENHRKQFPGPDKFCGFPATGVCTKYYEGGSLCQ